MTYPNKYPAVSILMSVYSEPIEWLKLAINSILEQTFEDFEFIIILDNPDSIEQKQVLINFKKNDERIILINNPVNLGLTKSLNIGLSECKGKYVARMDADDISAKNRLEKQFQFMEHNLNYYACGSNAFKIDGEVISNKVLTKPESDEEIKSFLFYESPIFHPSLFFRNIVVDKLHYDEKYIYSQDFDFISRLSILGNLKNIQEPLIYYRFSSNQISSQKREIQNNFGAQIRSQNIKRELSNTLYIEPEIVEEIKIDEIISKLTIHKELTLNSSAIIYSLLFYNRRSSIKDSILFIKFLFILKIPFKYRARLLTSIFKTFKDQI